MLLLVKRAAAAAGTHGPSYTQVPALELQPDPQCHAQVQQGLKGSASDTDFNPKEKCSCEMSFPAEFNFV